MTGEGLNRPLWMIPFVRFHGSNDGQLVHVLRHARENLRNLHAGGVRRNRPEAAIALHIPTIQMADSTFQPDHNHRLAFGLSGRTQTGERVSVSSADT